jgi:pyruvate/2-oxoglutarate dehydrogenase complex dihydrolipoamide dehydrogenase (E3) component
MQYDGVILVAGPGGYPAAVRAAQRALSEAVKETIHGLEGHMINV